MSRRYLPHQDEPLETGCWVFLGVVFGILVAVAIIVGSLMYMIHRKQQATGDYYKRHNITNRR